MEHERDESASGEEVGSVKVHVTKRQIHNAVRNILANEMKLDPVEVKNEVHSKAHELIANEVIDYISKAGYGHADIKAWAGRAMAQRMQEVDTILKQSVKELVQEHLRQQVVKVVEGIITDGLTVRLGWNPDYKVKVRMEESHPLDHA